MNKLEKKRDKLLAELKDTRLLSVQDFIPSDIALGLFIGFFGAGVCLLIPVIGWVALPVVLILSPFMATKARQDANAKKSIQIKKKLDAINAVLG